jgi:hypothetical protein
MSVAKMHRIIPSRISLGENSKELSLIAIESEAELLKHVFG